MREEPRCNRTTCGYKSPDEEAEPYTNAPFPARFVGCAVIVVIVVIVGILAWAWSHGVEWKGVVG